MESYSAISLVDYDSSSCILEGLFGERAQRVRQISNNGGSRVLNNIIVSVAIHEMFEIFLISLLVLFAQPETCFNVAHSLLHLTYLAFFVLFFFC